MIIGFLHNVWEELNLIGSLWDTGGNGNELLQKRHHRCLKELRTNDLSSLGLKWRNAHSPSVSFQTVMHMERPINCFNRKASMYDTSQDAVAEVTYRVPPFPLSVKEPVPRPPKESVYVKSLFNPKPIPLDGPVEVFLHKELSNPHSRAKKQARWQAHKRRTAAMLKECVEEEVKNLKGRTVHEARADATWIWRQKVDEEKRAGKERRRKNKGTEARLIRKKARKERKERKQRERLTEMVLRDEPNQIIPSLPRSP